MFKRRLLSVIILFLFVLPFFWLPYNTMDLGGDSSRLYFYNPISYLYNFSLFNIASYGVGNVEPSFFSIPFLLLLSVLKSFISSYFIITLFNSVKLTLGFLFIYLIVQEFLKGTKKLSQKNSYLAAIGAGFVYIFMCTMTDNWDKALLSHSQFFVNPASFYLLLKYFQSQKFKYMVVFLFLSFIFSHSFAYTSAPSFFAFFPIAILFIFTYTFFILKKKIKYTHLLIAFIFFIGLQAFHIIPQIANLTDANSNINSRFFDKETIQHEGVRYYVSILPIAKVSNYILLSFSRDRLIMLVVPFIILIGLIFNKAEKKVIVLCSLFYLLCLLLLSANVTDVWREIYKNFFYIPGFSMFRNFIGQWLYVYSFFYATLFGLAFYSFLGLFGTRLKGIAFVIVTILIFISGSNFIAGQSVNKILLPGTQTKIASSFSDDFEKSLFFVRGIPTSNKVLTLPFTDSFYQLVPDREYRGVYIGPSIISYIGGKQDFAGFQTMESFGNTFLELAKSKKFKEIRKLMGILNVEYIYWNSDPFVLDKNNEPFLYGYVGNSLPKRQRDYLDFIKKLGATEVFRSGYYRIFALDAADLSPQIFVPEHIAEYKGQLDIHQLSKNGVADAYIEKDDCLSQKQICKTHKREQLVVKYQKINPTKYYVTVRNASDPYIMVLSQAFDKGWKVYQDAEDKFYGKEHEYKGKFVYEYPQRKKIVTDIFETLFLNPINESNHFAINGYANAWSIKPDTKVEQHFIIELSTQRVFYFSCLISVVAFTILAILAVLMYARIKTIIE